MQRKVLRHLHARGIAIWYLFAVSILTLVFNLSGYAQTVSLDLKSAPLETAFQDIRKQTGYNFIYTRAQLAHAQPVTISCVNLDLEQALSRCFKDQRLSYTVNDRYIIVAVKKDSTTRSSITHSAEQVDISGKITNAEGDAVAGATISAIRSNKATSSDRDGRFVLKGIEANDELYITSIGYQPRRLIVNNRTVVTVQLASAIGNLDETIVIGYGTTSRRLNTGNIGKVGSEQLARQPVANPMAALHGRVAGAIISQSNGFPGAAMTIRIRGRNSIAQGNDPLFVIDGVPMATNNNSLGQVGSALNANTGNRGPSPLASLNPQDIESIEILKDADATSIYGSLAANGVVLITTKTGKPGKTKVSVNYYTGWSRAARTAPLLNTQQYLMMRREAFANDSVIMTNANAYDLLLWDTTRYTDFRKMLIGGTAQMQDAMISLSGGDERTQLLVSGGYRRESTITPGSDLYQRGSMHMNVNHRSNDKRFKLNFSFTYGLDKNNNRASDLTGVIMSAIPNLPSLYDSTGRLKWIEKGVGFINPLAFLYKNYKSQSHHLNGSLRVSYQLARGLFFQFDGGYNRSNMDELSTNPVASQNPLANPTGSASFANSSAISVTLEPQLNYAVNFGKHRFTFMTGTTYLARRSRSAAIDASGYSNDLLIEYATAAPIIQASNNVVNYRYNAIFARASYHYANRYILNLSGRRDGSSRFGPGRQFAQFGAIGAAWLFSNEDFFKSPGQTISFGKLRLSYGTAGNDNIGDYQYLSSWRPTLRPFQGQSGLEPVNLFNPDYSWELNRKLEAGIEMGFIKDRVFLSVSYFQNRSGNQLVQYSLPTQTGFSNIITNFPALVENVGWETELRATLVQTRRFDWSIEGNISFTKNRLLEFPNLATSPYGSLVIGQPLSSYTGFRFRGVNPLNGYYQYETKSGITQTPSTTTDLVKPLGHLDPKFFGGVGTSIRWMQWTLDAFGDFRKQNGPNYRDYIAGNVPGRISNQFIWVLDNWKKPGDIKDIQKFTQATTGPSGQSASYFSSIANSGRYGNASFFRLRNLSVAYALKEAAISRWHLQSMRCFFQGQNLWTITRYLGGDPETLSVGAMPPLKSYTLGIQLSF